MGDLLTAAEAAKVLGMTEAGVYKLITRGHLPRRANGRRDPKARGIVDRADVEQLAAVRLREHQAEQQRRAEVRKAAQDAPGRRYTPPNTDHEWIGTDEVAAMLGVTTQAIAQRCRTGTIPAMRVGNKWWIRADHARIAANVRAADGPEAVVVALDGIN